MKERSVHLLLHIPVGLSLSGLQQRLKHLGHHSLSSRKCMSRKLELEAELELEHRHLNMECRHFKW